LRQFAIARRRRTWAPVEFCVSEVGNGAHTGRAAYHAVCKPSWKPQIDVQAAEGGDGTVLFSIRSRDIFARTHDVVDAGGGLIGVLSLGGADSQPRVTDVRQDVMAQLVGSALLLCQGHELTPCSPIVCELRGLGSPFDQHIGLSVCDASALDLSLMLSLGIVLAQQGSGSGGDGAA
jgi:hypothetical protein